mmetsp:Transcript_119388/g.385465  ORF Transcript_119388/g.385465 Transcript_119388/m.385465 type:complete len:87 (+) Transcript_119388:903-1163(+)
MQPARAQTVAWARGLDMRGSTVHALVEGLKLSTESSAWSLASVPPMTNQRLPAMMDVAVWRGLCIGGSSCHPHVVRSKHSAEFETS